jgi:hypothetical protein
MLQEFDSPQTFQPDSNRDFQTTPMPDMVDEVFLNNIEASVNEVFDDPFLYDVEAIYQSQSDSSTNPVFRPELVANLDSRKLYAIGDRIKSARNYKLDSVLLNHSERQDNFIGSVAKLLFGQGFRKGRLESLTEGNLRSKESELGASIFGPMARNEQIREFFYDTRIADRDSWFFHQVVVDNSSTTQEVTLHYEVHPMGILRISSDPSVKNEFIHGQELQDFMKSASMYQELVTSKLYASSILKGNHSAT